MSDRRDEFIFYHTEKKTKKPKTEMKQTQFLRVDGIVKSLNAGFYVSSFRQFNVI